MPRRSILLLAAGMLAGGCSRDAPLVAPETEAIDAIVAPSSALAPSAVGRSTDALDDALIRLVPALGEYGAALPSILLKLKDSRSKQVASNELRRVLDLLSTTLPAEYYADFDALRLELGVAMN